jgi:hypothetical protein
MTMAETDWGNLKGKEAHMALDAQFLVGDDDNHCLFRFKAVAEKEGEAVGLYVMMDVIVFQRLYEQMTESLEEAPHLTKKPTRN